MDGGAWRATVHGVAKSQTRLSDSLSLFTFMHWRGKWQPTPVFLPGESQRWWSLVGCRLWGQTESDTTEVTWQQQQQWYSMGFLDGSEMWVWSLGQEDPWRRKWLPAPVVLPGKSYGQRNLVGYIVHRVTESDMTYQLNLNNDIRCQELW